MTTDSETPNVPVQSDETPTASAQPTETPKPAQPVVPEPAPVNQTPYVAAAPQQPVTAPENKKSSTPKILLIILAIAVVASGVFYMTFNSSQMSKDKTEQSINEEKARLAVIIHEVDQAVSDKEYDQALLEINSINWLYEPDANKGYVDQYNSQRENLRKTIEQLKANERLENENQANQKANAVTPQPAQSSDSIQ